MKGKKAQAGMIVGITITAIIAIVIITTMWTFLQDNSLADKTALADTVTLTSDTGTVDNSDTIALSSFYNTTHSFVVNVEANLSRGVITAASNFSNGAYFANYTYYPSGYVTSGTARTILGLLPLFAALLILVFVVGFIGMKRQ